jgi:peptidoglycan/xylan/chitin deacetylase (PgdA/CDA1 family)
MRNLTLIATVILLFCITAQAQQRKEPIVVLGFDDAEISHCEKVAPLLKKFGYDATFFVCEFPRNSPGDSVYFMKWPQIRALYDQGFEIGNHTGHHKNMTKMTPEQMRAEVSFTENKCKAYGIPKPISFAYPGNREDSLSRVVLKEMGYQYARTGGSRYYDPLQQSPLEIPSYTMGSGGKLKDRTWNALRNLQPGQILAFTIHGVPDIAHPDYSTSVDDLTAYLQYMKDHHFKVIAFRDLAQYTASK